MFHLNVLNLLICGSILSFILGITILVITKGNVNATALAFGMFFICVLIPVLLYCGFEGVSERAHQEEGTPIIKLSSVDLVFSNVAGDPYYTYYNRDPKQSFGFPDGWYDKNGDLGKNIDFDILSNTKVQLSFYGLDDETCKGIQRLGKMYNGVILDPKSCDKRGDVSVLFEH